jgi:hypothetical protein
MGASTGGWLPPPGVTVTVKVLLSVSWPSLTVTVTTMPLTQPAWRVIVSVLPEKLNVARGWPASALTRRFGSAW